MLGETKNNPVANPPLSAREQRRADKLVEQKKKINIFLSRRSGEENSTGYQSSSSAFAGGEVKSRSRVSFVGRENNEGEIGHGAVENVRNRLGFAQGGGCNSAKSGFAQRSGCASTTKASGSNRLSRPLGFK
jgi:hypothetical protein